MSQQEKIIREIADAECERISRKVILALQKQTDCLMSGGDSGLKNVWDEICVQIQQEYSNYWNLYVETVEGLVEAEVNKLPIRIQEAIWLQTETGWNSSEENICIFHNELSRYIAEDYIFSKASDWSNRRIHFYIYGEYP